VAEVLAFATSSAQKLVGEIQSIFPVSARQAQRAKTGQNALWAESGFEALETFIHDTLDDEGRFRLKLLNPLGVGQRLVKKQLGQVENNLADLEEDTQLLKDIHSQTVYYDEDMKRNFQARLGEIDNILFEMERRGRDFFDEMFRIGRIPDLVRGRRVQDAFEQQVVADTPRQIEERVSELVDWMVEQDLRQWSAVGEHLARRKQAHEERIVGQTGPRDGTLAYDRQRLIDSIGLASRQAVESYDMQAEAEAMAELARTSVTETALLEIGGLGLGAAITALATATWIDVTGIAAGVTFMTLGLLVLPARKRRATQELESKLASLRQRLMGSLTDRFEREMRRSSQRVEDTVAPFSRFVRSEQEKHEQQLELLSELEAHIAGLKQELQPSSELRRPALASPADASGGDPKGGRQT
jgi:hypothetical protein